VSFVKPRMDHRQIEEILEPDMRRLLEQLLGESSLFRHA